MRVLRLQGELRKVVVVARTGNGGMNGVDDSSDEDV